jgi:hypothetical protein
MDAPRSGHAGSAFIRRMGDPCSSCKIKYLVATISREDALTLWQTCSPKVTIWQSQNLKSAQNIVRPKKTISQASARQELLPEKVSNRAAAKPAAQFAEIPEP